MSLFLMIFYINNLLYLQPFALVYQRHREESIVDTFSLLSKSTNDFNLGFLTILMKFQKKFNKNMFKLHNKKYCK